MKQNKFNYFDDYFLIYHSQLTDDNSFKVSVVFFIGQINEIVRSTTGHCKLRQTNGRSRTSDIYRHEKYLYVFSVSYPEPLFSVLRRQTKEQLALGTRDLMSLFFSFKVAEHSFLARSCWCDSARALALHQNKNKQDVDSAIALFAKCQHYLCYFSS